MKKPNNFFGKKIVGCFFNEKVPNSKYAIFTNRVIFDQHNEEEKITSKIFKKTAKEDDVIQPMLKGIRNNNIAVMYKYEDIMINLDELIQNYNKNTQYEGIVQAAMKES